MEQKKTKVIDLNCDIGETYGFKEEPSEKRIIKSITSANIACGFHAGDPLKMLKMAELCKKNNVQVGAHPGYPDPLGFGRRDIEITPEELEAYLLYQWGAMDFLAGYWGLKVKHIKLHGALYNKVAYDEQLSREVFRAVSKLDSSLILVAPWASVMYKLAVESGVRVAGEVFADRAYTRDGSLVPRNKPGAVMDNPQMVLDRISEIVRGEIKSADGAILRVQADTVCLHGDTVGAVALAEMIRESLAMQGVSVIPMQEFI